MANACTHLDQIRDVIPVTPEGCEECLKTGDRWVHLRLCLTCGHVGCCDSSPNRHATKHFHATRHPIVESFQPGEDWRWCYIDQVMLEPTAGRESADQAMVDPETSSRVTPGGLLSRLLGSRHRRNYVVGVLHDPGAADRAAKALVERGFAPDEIVLQTGEEINERMQSGDLGNLVREAMTEEGSICRDYNDKSRGGAILSVYTTDANEVEIARKVLAEHGADSLKHFGDWTITKLPAQVDQV